MKYQIMVISTYMHDTCDNELTVFREYETDNVHSVPICYVPKIRTLFDKHSNDEWETKVIIMAINDDCFTVSADIGLFDDNALYTFSVFDEFKEWTILDEEN